MTVNPLPPQAYTKDTLQKAYAWLLSQSASVKDMAQDQNMLVSLYLKAQRNGDAALETPSIQNFKQELKSLASMMGDFQSPQQATQTVPHQVTQPTAAHASPVRSASTVEGLNFDQKTLEAIAHVRETFNLSTDSEAIRALIALGIKQFRKTGL